MGLQIFCKPIFAGCDMKGKQATYLEIASLCRELALLLHAGVRAGDGLALLAEEEPEAQRRKQLEEMARQVDDGASLGEALAGQGLFPAYVTGLVTVGERSGRTEEALNALSVYYEQRDQLDRQVRSALLYPSVLLVLMLVVIVVLLAKVLPVFDQVYASLGGELTGVAGGLLTLGRALDAAMPVLCAVLGVVVIFLAVFSLSGGFRERLLAFWQRRFGDRGVSRRLNDARFAQAMAMGLQSGLPMEETLELAAGLLSQTPAAAERCRSCKAQLQQGEELSGAMRESGVLPPAACRLLALGVRGGTADTVMEEIARRLAREGNDALSRKVAQVEPALVLVTSLLVGAILLSVMLPLMNIMAAIG